QRDRDVEPIQDPPYRDLRRRRSRIVGQSSADVLDEAQVTDEAVTLKICVDRTPATILGAETIEARVLAAENSLPQATPGQEREIPSSPHRFDSTLVSAIGEAELEGAAHESGRPGTEGLRADELVGDAIPADDARFTLTLQPGEDLLPRSRPVPVVHLVEIDVVGAKTSQARGERALEPGSRVVTRGDSGFVEADAELRCDRHILAAAAERSTK